MVKNNIKTRLKREDNVVVISGSERGKRGKVLNIDRKKGRVIVEGINKRNKFIRATQENPKGGAVTLEFPINLTNVMIFCDKCKKPVRIGIELKDNAKSRVCKKCGKSLDK